MSFLQSITVRFLVFKTLRSASDVISNQILSEKFQCLKSLLQKVDQKETTELTGIFLNYLNGQ